MTTVGGLWLGLSDEQRDRAAAALRGVLHETGTSLVLAIARAAHAEAPKAAPRHADTSPYLFPANAATASPKRCYDCDTELIVDPIPFWLKAERRRVYLGSTCWKKRMFPEFVAAQARHEALVLPIDQRGGETRE